jgi:hypothetical protein
MKTFKTSVFFLFLASIVIVVMIHGCNGGFGFKKTEKKGLSFENLKAISLKRLQMKISSATTQEMTEIKNFCGISKLYGFYWNEKENDLILFGEADKSKPHLLFDDFVVSLRQAYMLYTETVNDTDYYNDPSCTIDPDINAWSRMDELNMQTSRSDTVSKDKEWASLCDEPQSVRVFGIPCTTHLASVMINADYFLKEITNGTRKVNNVEGFKSMTDLRREKAIEVANSGKQPPLGSPVNRFEFTAGEAYFENSENIYILNEVPVILVTEAEVKTKTEFKGTGMADPMAKIFAESFTESYNDIAKIYPVYDTLLNAYRVYAVAKAIPTSNLISDITFFDPLLKHYKIDSVPVPAAVPGKSVVSRLDYRISDVPYTQYLYACGGVNLNSKIQTSALKGVINRDLMQNISKARPGTDVFQWNFSFKKSPWTIQIKSCGFLLK